MNQLMIGTKDISQLSVSSCFSSPALIMTPSGLLGMTGLIIDMALVTTMQLMLLLATWSIYSKQEVLSDLFLEVSDATPTKQGIGYEPDDPVRECIALHPLQNKLQAYQHGQSPAQLAQPAPAYPGPCQLPTMPYRPATNQHSACPLHCAASGCAHCDAHPHLAPKHTNTLL